MNRYMQLRSWMTFLVMNLCILVWHLLCYPYILFSAPIGDFDFREHMPLQTQSNWGLLIQYTYSLVVTSFASTASFTHNFLMGLCTPTPYFLIGVYAYSWSFEEFMLTLSLLSFSCEFMLTRNILLTGLCLPKILIIFLSQEFMLTLDSFCFSESLCLLLVYHIS